MYKSITSPQNTFIKECFQLKEKSRKRRQSGTFLIEGVREISLAVKGAYELSTLLVLDEKIDSPTVSELINSLDPSTDIISISNEVYKKLALRESTEGTIAIGKSKKHELNTIQFKTENPLILVAEAPEKPGNIGALLRTADAANIDAVFIANPKTDLYNSNIIRSSVGCVFTTQVGMGTTSEIIDFLKTKNINIYGAALTASVAYTSIDFKKASAIVVGTEATGLSNEWLNNTTQNIIIPMRGTIDSMNVSVSAAIITFEAVRQRKQ
jgi:TrmH family RNA methyltransferase